LSLGSVAGKELVDLFIQKLLQKEGIFANIICQYVFSVKQKCGGIPELISSVAQQELKHLPHYIKECALVYIPEIGYLLSLPPWKEPMTDEDWKVPGIEFLVGIYEHVSLHIEETGRLMGKIKRV
jgi:hypothetical protein